MVPITLGADGSLAFNGDGTPVEYAIEMTRFDERQTFDHLAEAGELDPALVNAIADAIAASHAAADHAPGEMDRVDFFPSSRAIPRHSAVPAAFPTADIDDLREASLSAFAADTRDAGVDAASKEMCGAVMATCIWPTSC